MSVEMVNYNWRAKAACYGASDEELFPKDPANDQVVRRYCRVCPVRELCLQDALRLGARYGVRGGLSEADRALLHDAHEVRANTFIARKIAMGRRRHLTQDDKLELADLRQARSMVSGSKISARQMFRYRIGELKAAGVEYRELVEYVRNWAVSDIAAERQVWRATFEYRTVLNREVTLATKARENFLFAASNARSGASQSYWLTKAADILLLP